MSDDNETALSDAQQKAAKAWDYIRWEGYNGAWDVITKVILDERKRAVEICAAECEWGGSIKDAQERIENGEEPRKIEGWNCEYETDG